VAIGEECSGTGDAIVFVAIGFLRLTRTRERNCFGAICQNGKNRRRSPHELSLHIVLETPQIMRRALNRCFGSRAAAPLRGSEHHA